MDIVFTSPGGLPAPWEDFIAQDKSVPNFTISTRWSSEEDAETFPSLDLQETVDGWVDIDVDVSEIDEDVARLAIAYHLGIDNPELIVIQQKRFCQSV